MKRKELKEALKDDRYIFYRKNKGFKINCITQYDRIDKRFVEDRIRFKIPTNGIIAIKE